MQLPLMQETQLYHCGSSRELYYHSFELEDRWGTQKPVANTQGRSVETSLTAILDESKDALAREISKLKTLPLSKALTWPVPTDGPHLHECIKYHLSPSKKVGIKPLTSTYEQAAF